MNNQMGILEPSLDGRTKILSIELFSSIRTNDEVSWLYCEFLKLLKNPELI